MKEEEVTRMLAPLAGLALGVLLASPALYKKFEAKVIARQK
jgi:hypothetical protein